MIKEEFILDTKPCSVNSMYYGDGRTKTQKTREWSYQLFHQMNADDIQEKLKNLRENFDENTQLYNVEFYWQFPKDKLITKSGRLSKNIFDITNIEKSLADLIFLPKYFDMTNPYGVKNLNIDDVFMNRLVSEREKSPDDDWHVRIVISIQDSPFLDSEDSSTDNQAHLE